MSRIKFQTNDSLSEDGQDVLVDDVCVGSLELHCRYGEPQVLTGWYLYLHGKDGGAGEAPIRVAADGTGECRHCGGTATEAQLATEWYLRGKGVL